MTGAPVDDDRRERHDWPSLLARAVAGAGIASHYQPVVDLARATVVGFEALARFPARPEAGPDRWFAAAHEHGCAAELEAAALRSAFAARDRLPTNTFLTVNVGPDLLGHPAIQRVWDEQGSLAGVVVELTEHARIDSYLALEPHLDRLRSAGALLAIDDAGAGYAGLQHLLGLRPAFIKLDRSLVTDLDRDEAKRALVEMVGTLASRIDAWILAEGVEREGELDALVKLEVPLAQGFYLARPAPPWAGLDPRPALRLVGAAADRGADVLRVLVEPAVTVASAAAGLAACAEDGVDLAVILDAHRRPQATVDPDGLVHAVHDSCLRVNQDTPVAQAARRAVTRAAGERFKPLLCTDNAGRFVGMVRMERVVSFLADRSAPGF